MFQLTRDEHQILRSQNVISKKRMKYQRDSSTEAKCSADEARGGRQYSPYAFTEQGVAMLMVA